MTQKIFVYGTLRTGMYNYDKYLKGKIIQSELAYVKGSLHEIHGVSYPALIVGEDMIAGEIMELAQEHIMDELDELEGWIKEGDPQNEYHKIIVDIYDDLGSKIQRLPVYFFNLDNPKHTGLLGERIACKDYVKYIYKQADARA